jgi:ATP-dependent Clp protease ATP-binding subunit ClpC
LKNNTLICRHQTKKKSPAAADSYNDDSGQIVLNNPANKSNKNKTPVLDNFGRDLTEMPEEGN